MPIDPSYDTDPRNITDGPWGGPGWHGVWITAWAVGLSPASVSIYDAFKGDVVQRGGNFATYGDQWERIWDDSQKTWRALTVEELAKLPPHPRCDADWVALWTKHYTS